MAQLKDTVVSGSLRATDTLYSTTAQFQILRVPTASNGTTYGPGSENNLLKSNGTSVYWTTLLASDIPNLSTDKLTSGTLPVGRGGTGAISFTANSVIMSGSTNTAALTTRAIYNKTAKGNLEWTASNVDIHLITKNTLAYWNGLYNSTSSNLAYCVKGEFGNAVTYDIDDATANGSLGTGTGLTTERSVYYGLVTVNNASQTRATGIYAPTSAGTANQILVSSGGTSAPTWKATANGAAYATSTNGTLTFGTLPIAQGGTGATDATGARTNLGLGSIAVKASTDYIPFKGNITSIGSNSPASGAKTYWADLTNIPNLSTAVAYNNSGSEYTLFFSKGGSNNYGSILKWGYPDKYLRILRYHYANGTNSDHWYSEDWEKISAGYADSAGADANGNTISSTYLKLIGGTLKNTAANSNTSLYVRTNKNDSYIELRADGEGGNLRLTNSDNTIFYEADAAGGNFRIYSYKDCANGSNDTLGYLIWSRLDGALTLRGGDNPNYATAPSAEINKGIINYNDSSGKQRFRIYSNRQTDGSYNTYIMTGNTSENGAYNQFKIGLDSNNEPTYSISSSIYDSDGNVATNNSTLAQTRFRNAIGASSGVWPISLGGTGATTAANARTNLGLGNVATYDILSNGNVAWSSSKVLIPIIGTDGVTELGKYIDFHSDTTAEDYDIRLTANTTSTNNSLVLQGSKNTVIFNVGNSIELRKDGEGGNLKITGPDGNSYFEIDAVNNTHLRVYSYSDFSNTSSTYKTINWDRTSGNLLNNDGTILAGNTTLTKEIQLRARSAAGEIYLYTQGSATGSKGLYSYNASGTGEGILVINQSNQISSLADINTNVNVVNGGIIIGTMADTVQRSINIRSKTGRVVLYTGVSYKGFYATSAPTTDAPNGIGKDIIRINNDNDVDSLAYFKVPVQIKSANNYDSTPSSNLATDLIQMYDSNLGIYHRLYSALGTDKSKTLFMMTRKSGSELNTYVQFGVKLNSDGSPGFALSAKNDGTETNAAARIAFRNTIGASSGVWPVSLGGTGQTTIANIQAGKDGNGDTISSTYLKLSGGTITGTLTVNSTLTQAANQAFSAGGSIEMHPATTSNHGGFIDFHYNNSTEDYTTRIIEAPARTLTIRARTGARGYLNLVAESDHQFDLGFGRSGAIKWALSSRNSSEAFFGLYNHVKSAWSIKVEESTHNIITSGQLQITNGSGNGIKMWKNDEGGNIRIYGKDDTSYYELDSYDSTSFRIVASNTHNTSAHTLTRWIEGDTTVNQQLYGTSQGFIQHMRKVGTSGYHLGSFIVFNNSGSLSFYEYPTDNTSGASANREYYNLPVPTAGRTSAAGFNILTTKNTVTVGQGGTGATSGPAALSNLFGSSYTNRNNAWSSIGLYSKNVTGKTDSYGNISLGIDGADYSIIALYEWGQQTYSIVAIPYMYTQNTTIYAHCIRATNNAVIASAEVDLVALYIPISALF